MARIELGRRARADLAALADLIESEGGRERADAYRARLLRSLRALETFPDAGGERPELGPGIRSFAFERRVTILFRRRPDSVLILRVLYAGRQP